MAKKVTVKKKYKIVSYRIKSKGWTRIYNTMFEYIDNSNAFKVYCYLCYRFNEEMNYSFPSLTTISNDCKIARSTVQKAVKYLEDKKLIKKFQIREEDGNYKNNCYRVNYAIEIGKEETTKQLFDLFIDDAEEEIVEVDVEMEIEENVTMFIDDEDEIVEIETQEDRD